MFSHDPSQDYGEFWQSIASLRHTHGGAISQLDLNICKGSSFASFHGCCWETFYIFAYCGLVVEIPQLLKFDFLLLPSLKFRVFKIPRVGMPRHSHWALPVFRVRRARANHEHWSKTAPPPWISSAQLKVKMAPVLAEELSWVWAGQKELVPPEWKTRSVETKTISPALP